MLNIFDDFLYFNNKSKLLFIKMRFVTSLFGVSLPKNMGWQYMKIGRNAIFGIRPKRNQDQMCADRVPKPLNLLISRKGKFRHSELMAVSINDYDVKFSLFKHLCRIAAILFGLFALAIGIILSTIPWLDYMILRQLRLWNGSLSFQYWQKPGVVRLTKVYIFNMTNAENFLNFNEKPKLQEVGPFVYKEDMEKVNIVFHSNGTVSYRHKKILNFVPEMSKDGDTRVLVPNIPLLTLSSQSKSLPRIVNLGLSMFISGIDQKPFVPVTAQELVFGYDDPLVSIAHRFFPKARRPMRQMGLLLGRNGTLDEVSTIFTGHSDMKEFGLLNRLNGLNKLPYWSEKPCNSITASEGSFFPPRDSTGEDIVRLWDKDLCRVLPLKYRGPVINAGINADFYTPIDDVFDPPSAETPDNECFCPEDPKSCPPKGLQNISPCQYSAPVYLSFPHFYKANPKLLEGVSGLQPKQKLHETYFKIQPKLGVPMEGKVRVQLNLKVQHQPDIKAVSNFPDIIFPIMWLEEDIAVPCIASSVILLGVLTLGTVVIKARVNIIPTHEAIELGKRTIRKSSTFIINGQTRTLVVKDSYILLDHNIEDARPIINN
ncbi:scavenger receptor class B member 1 isoform X3 [Aphidius gifuensis]|uniref:scavenger receptor class B member 1 isoform X3 n=1 Tax=Aphidius gifuensis TaxID=684658 RepID=UPI001CDB7F8B|nr:scavenger receptor class B member 1 isoform X3 [Aphidius gifuensis]